ncbi:hypothetical protein [Gillisia marina]|uniref:hypothetical protein n=1 Tax=Gillisia marina TaxID=1167637 RepID=UPI000299DE30|nr:hypothetical protein [Gillisia marina]
MKTLVLTLTLLIYTVTLHSQDYAVSTKSKSKIEKSTTSYSSLTQFTSEVISIENFKYRDYLKEAKKSNASYHLDGKIFTKVELTKLLRKNAISSESYEDFSKGIEKNYPQLKSVLSDEELQALYENFRKGALNTYIQNLTETW